ncbi:diguanylate cyclase [Paraburkholderia humisilvae]|nr:diguanylate cyclase [Paraburkholderia humisilvae]
MVMLNLVMTIWQTCHDFSALNERTGHRLDALASSIALRVQDRAEMVDETLSLVGDAIDRGTLSDRELQGIALLSKETLGDVTIAVFDKGGQTFATSTSVTNHPRAWFGALPGDVTAESSTNVRPIYHDSRWGLLFLRDHRSEAGAVNARIAMIVPVDQKMMRGIAFDPGSAALLLNHDDRVIARYPLIPVIETGSVFHGQELKRKGPTPSTYYTLSPLDKRERLATTRIIPIGTAGDSWTLDLGFAVDEYRLPWLQGVYINVASMAIEFALLLAGIVLVRRENRLHKQVETWAGFVSTIISNIPTPIALVDLGTGKIAQTNEVLESMFGARATVGKSFSALFADPENRNNMGAKVINEPVVMCTRAGSVHMIVRCTPLHGYPSRSEDKGLVLVTLVDVSHQCEQIRQLRTEAEVDALTKLPNRRHFDRVSRLAVAHAQQGQSPLTVLAMDLDHFKRVNDTWGHAAGDRVLEVVAERFNAALRGQDLPARVGGEEFAAILQDASPEQARAIAERIRLAVASTPIVTRDGQIIAVTVSIGMATYQHGEADLSAASARADAALYRAKHGGRNRVETCDVGLAESAAEAP